MNETLFPNGNDRTPNDPAVLISWKSARKIYEANHTEDNKPPSFDEVYAWFLKKYRDNNFSQITSYGKSILLVASVSNG